MFKAVQDWVDEQKYDNWEVWFLIGTSVLKLDYWMNLQILTDLVVTVGRVVVVADITVTAIMIAALQGAFVGLIGHRLYDYGDRYYAFVDQLFDDKETAVVTRISLMALVGVFISLMLPSLVEQYAQFEFVQTAGTVILSGYTLVHLEVSNWNLSEEAPVLIAGLVLATLPVTP